MALYAATISAVLLALSLALLAVFGSVSRKAHLPGVLIPSEGIVTVQAPVSGFVGETRFHEGQHVTAGALLLAIDTERISITGDGIRKTNLEVSEIIHKRLAALRQQRDLHQRTFDDRDRALGLRVQLIDEQVRQVRAEESLIVRRVQLAKDSLARQESLARTGFVSQAQLQSRAEEHLELEARLQTVRRAMTSLKGERAAAEAERVSASNQLAAQLAEVERSESAVQQELLEASARAKTFVTAPSTGVVTATELVAGSAVQAGQPLLTITRTGNAAAHPQVKLVAHLFAPSRSAGFLREGQVVQLRMDAFPFQKFGFVRGRVHKVSKSPFAISELPASVSPQLASRIAGHEGGVFRVVVEFEAPQGAGEVALKAGDTLEADVTLETRAIWEWMFEPLIRLRRVA